MDRIIFDKFFCLGEVYVGPEIISPSYDGNWLGKVRIIPTKYNILMGKQSVFVGVREFNNVITEDLFNTLNYLSIEKSEFDKLVNKYYLIEWESTKMNPKPNISSFIHRAYL